MDRRVPRLARTSRLPRRGTRGAARRESVTRSLAAAARPAGPRAPGAAQWGTAGKALAVAASFGFALLVWALPEREPTDAAADWTPVASVRHALPAAGGIGGIGGVPMPGYTPAPPGLEIGRAHA